MFKSTNIQFFYYFFTVCQFFFVFVFFTLRLRITFNSLKLLKRFPQLKLLAVDE